MEAILSRPALARARSLLSHPLCYDAAAAAVVAATSLSEMHEAAHAAGWPYHHATDLAGIMLVAAACVALAAERFVPRAAVLVTLAVTITLSGTGYVAEPPVHLLGVSGPTLGPVLALYALALRHSRSRSVPILVCAIVAGSVAQALIVPGSILTTLPGTAAVFFAAWGIGDARRTRRQYVESVRARAERLDRERHAMAAMAVADERTRIARELHDIVAHHVSLMIVTAAAADRQVSRDPSSTRIMLRDLIATGQAAVTEMRRMLGVLRSDSRQGDAEELRPQPTLTELETLVATFTSAGLAVGLNVTGPRTQLPAGVELTAYRILQESLTNVLRHAGAGTRVNVTVDYRPGTLFLEVRDHGGAAHAHDSPGPGHGLIGMKERAALLGGQLEAALLPGGGFRVRATLPVGEDQLARTASLRSTA
jgi:signal transduction histidine kinase